MFPYTQPGGERMSYKVPFRDIDCHTADTADTAVVRSTYRAELEFKRKKDISCQL